MDTSTVSTLVGLTALTAVISLQVYLSRHRGVLAGSAIPVAFLVLAAVNLYRSLFVPNPYPTMREGMLMTAGLAGFVVTGLVLLLVRRRASPQSGSRPRTPRILEQQEAQDRGPSDHP